MCLVHLWKPVFQLLKDETERVDLWVLVPIDLLAGFCGLFVEVFDVFYRTIFFEFAHGFLDLRQFAVQCLVVRFARDLTADTRNRLPDT